MVGVGRTVWGLNPRAVNQGGQCAKNAGTYFLSRCLK
jgi:hypothetical protein